MIAKVLVAEKHVKQSEMDDKAFNELQLRATIVPQQVRWPDHELHWQRLHEVVNEARERVSKAYMQMDEIDRNADLSGDGKYRQRRKGAAESIADFEASKTLTRAREAVEFAVGKQITSRRDPKPGMPC